MNLAKRGIISSLIGLIRRDPDASPEVKVERIKQTANNVEGWARLFWVGLKRTPNSARRTNSNSTLLIKARKKARADYVSKNALRPIAQVGSVMSGFGVKSNSYLEFPPHKQAASVVVSTQFIGGRDGY